MTELSPRIDSLPKAELHLHLEGSIQPATACILMARQGVQATEQEVRRRYTFGNFQEFLEAFKWITSLLRDPQDYALVATDLAEHLLTQNVVYAEVTLSVGVMLLRKQRPEVNFEALLRATEPFERRGLRLRWVFDAVRQFGAEAAMAVVEAARSCGSNTVVAFGIGGDELQVPTAEFRGVYDRVREAIELLRVERIGHGIAAIQDPSLMDLLAERKIPLELCPQSNLRTGALARQLARHPVQIEDHPLPVFFRHEIPVVLSTDDPALFDTNLRSEYAHAAHMGLQESELEQTCAMGFHYAFQPSSQTGTP
ncbi:MAG: adenosine deaminase [Acidobacteria bacterium]|nr:MAG: adenosine deaminase [Acidobacteriota bacterium]